MNEFIYDNFEHILCGLVLLSRLSDIGSTYLVSPTLKLEANPIVKKFKWPFAFLTLILCLVPYYHPGAASMIIVVSFLVSASNIGKFWFVRTMGEDKYLEMFLNIASKSKLSHALFSVLMSSFFVFLTGLFMIFLSSNSEEWGWWFGFGVLIYSLAAAIYGSLYYYKLFKKVQNLPEANPNENIDT